LKKTFEDFLRQGDVPNLLLVGGPGVGKTTVAMALLEQLGNDYYMINGSLRGNIDTLRNEIAEFASSISFSGGRKFVILDEADYLNPNSTQPSLRGFMEEFSANCGFILTCNYGNRIIDPIKSRCSVVEFHISKQDKLEIMKKYITRCTEILTQEKIDFDVKAVAALVKAKFPDFRRIINELQRYSATGKIDAGILAGLKDGILEPLLLSLKDKQFTDMRKWVGENSDIDFSVFVDRLYEVLADRIESRCLPQLVLTLNEYDYKSAFVVNKELNTVAMLTEIMSGVQFKE
jgi:replication factor C small subunit